MNAAAFLIAIAPLVGLLVCLILNRYPGELAIQRLRRLVVAIFSGRIRGGIRVPIGFRPSVRGGCLIAASLAGRGPPRSL